MLAFDDPLPRTPRRVLVAGVSGVGKTTLATRIATALERPHVEIDSLYHGPGWTPRTTFLDDVRSLAAEDSWVTEWQYAAARPVLAARADTLIWLDLPFLTSTLPRVVWRTLLRRLRHEVLWNGNLEPPLHTFLTDREHIVRWAIANRNKYQRRIPELQLSQPHLTIVRLASQSEVERWLDGPLLRSAG